jgi:hypothetical protein
VWVALWEQHPGWFGKPMPPVMPSHVGSNGRETPFAALHAFLARMRQQGLLQRFTFGARYAALRFIHAFMRMHDELHEELTSTSRWRQSCSPTSR